MICIGAKYLQYILVLPTYFELLFEHKKPLCTPVILFHRYTKPVEPHGHQYLRCNGNFIWNYTGVLKGGRGTLSQPLILEMCFPPLGQFRSFCSSSGISDRQYAQQVKVLTELYQRLLLWGWQGFQLPVFRSSSKYVCWQDRFWSSQVNVNGPNFRLEEWRTSAHQVMELRVLPGRGGGEELPQHLQHSICWWGLCQQTISSSTWYHPP